ESFDEYTIERVSRKNLIPHIGIATRIDPMNLHQKFAGWLRNIIAATLFLGACEKAAALGPPTLLAPGIASSPGPVLATLTPQFNWTSVSGATGYGLYIFDITTNSFVFQNVGGSRTGTSYNLPSGYLSHNGHAFRWFMTSF